jgi:REP-associated tyrosine transposase
MSQRIPLDRMYEYRRMLPHYQKPARALFVTFCKLSPKPFSAEARDAVMQCCLKGHGNRFLLHAAVVMPEHGHLLLTPLCNEKGWPYGLPAILKLIKGASARSVNKLLDASGPLWQEESFDHVLRSQESLEEKPEYIRQNPVRRRLVKRPRDLSLALGRTASEVNRVVGPVWVGHFCPTPLTLESAFRFRLNPAICLTKVSMDQQCPCGSDTLVRQGLGSGYWWVWHERPRL